MFRSLLVPLDRSPFAEQALPLAVAIARRAGAGLDLVQAHVLYALEENYPARLPYYPEMDVRAGQEEQLYLDATARWVATVSPVPVTTAVVPGPVGDAILDRARDRKADLIVLTTHGRGPLSRFFLGSVADELIRRARVPVLVVRPAPTAPDLLPEPAFATVLIPLDGSPLAEAVLEPALDLAGLMEARCHLLRVVDGGASGAAWVESALRAKRDEATAYLEDAAARVRARGLPVATQVVVASRPAEAILEAVGALDGCLLALATHGRGGVRRLLLGSVADEVVRGATGPVLVYRPAHSNSRLTDSL
jgi:nucleotide-binding universal stress UspA family protein